MATYTVDFTGDTVGSAPAGFTSRWDAPGVGIEFSVESVASAPNGVALRIVPNGVLERRFWSVDAAGDASTSTQIRALMRTVGWPLATASVPGPQVVLQASGDGAAETGVTSAYHKADASTGNLIARSSFYDAGALTSELGTPATSGGLNDWKWVEGTYDGTALTGEIRAVGVDFARGAVESSVTNTVTLGAGRPGILYSASSAALVAEIAWIGIGTGGDAAPIYGAGVEVLGVTNSSPLRRVNGDIVASETGISVWVYPRTGMTVSFGNPLNETAITVATDVSGNFVIDLSSYVGLTLGDALALVCYKPGADFAAGQFGADFVTVVDIG